MKDTANTHRDQRTDIIASMEGYSNFVLMVDKEKGDKL